MEIRKGTATEFEAIVQLLRDSELPVCDLTIEHAVLFQVIVDDAGGLIGSCAVEPHGSSGLLRSLAVLESLRGRGAGSQLVSAVEAAARDAGIRDLYLLTTTARVFFERLGYVPIERAGVPEAIKRSTEYCSICPDSAAVLRKRLD